MQHARYSTLSVLHTIEVMLGIPPLSAYDATAAPMYAAFGTTAHAAPFVALSPRIDINARNKKAAEIPGNALADYSHPDGRGTLSSLPAPISGSP